MAGSSTAVYTAEPLASSGSLENNQQQWNFAVPVTVLGTKSGVSQDSSAAYSKTKDRSSNVSQNSSYSKQNLAHESATSRAPRDHSLSRRGSESENMRDLYRLDSASRNAGNVKASGDARHMNGYTKDDANSYVDEDPDHANWIHRDKLARIESEELQQATMFLKRQVRTGSKSSASVGPGHNSVATPSLDVAGQFTEPWPSLRDEQQEPLDSSSPPRDDVNKDPIYAERMNWDLRLPEEIAAEEQRTSDAAAGIYRSPGLRKSSSRIPILTSSPVPLTPDKLGREVQSKRSRALTNGDNESTPSTMPRRASEPITTDATESVASPSSRPNSRGMSSGRKAPANATPGSANRKTSAPPTPKATPTLKQRTTSGASTSEQRPTTRSGERRPINRPEGDPPWLATMYKPDPRLPPDQQILPTHARRMQQEQWEKEGKAPSAYDREFAPLAVHADRPQDVAREAEKPEEAATPKDVQKADSSVSPEIREPSKLPSIGAGYSPIPKIQSPPTASAPALNWTPPVVTAQQPLEQTEKGCGCCIVM